METNDNYLSDNEVCTPEEIKNAAKEITLNLLSDKSRKKYEYQYKVFMDWCDTKQVKKYSDNVILAYMSELTQKYKPSTLWSVYSMLKTTLAANNDIKIENFSKITVFLKKQSVGYKAKKSKTLNRKEINKFILEAPDDSFLMTKVVLIIGIAGACRCDELTNITIDDVVDKDDILIVNIPDTKTNTQRTFTICNTRNESSIDVLSICRRYFKLRPKNINSRRLFLKYSAGKCAAQNVGKHKIGALPSVIAKYLNLSNPEEYTGHCFRRSSATLLADSGADLLVIKKHGGWKSSNVAEGYIDNSIQNKILVAEKILGGKKTAECTIVRPEEAPQRPSTDNSYEINTLELPIRDDQPNSLQINSENFTKLSSQGISINNCTNCTINFHISK